MDYVYNTGEKSGSGREVYEDIKADYYTTDYAVLTFWIHLEDKKRKPILSIAPGGWCEVFEEEK